MVPPGVGSRLDPLPTVTTRSKKRSSSTSSREREKGPFTRVCVFLGLLVGRGIGTLGSRAPRPPHPAHPQKLEFGRHCLYGSVKVGLWELKYTVKRNYEIPGFVLTKPSWDGERVYYSRPGRVW